MEREEGIRGSHRPLGLQGVFSSEGARCQPSPGCQGWGGGDMRGGGLLKYLFALLGLKGTQSYPTRPWEQHPGEGAKRGEGLSQVSIRPWRAWPRDRETPLLSFLPHLQTPPLSGGLHLGFLVCPCQGHW